MSQTFLSASYGLMAMKCGRCRLASHCIQLAVSGSRLPWPSNTRMQCSQRASTPILLLRAPRFHPALGELAAAAVAGRARGRRVTPRQPADRERDARPEVRQLLRHRARNLRQLAALHDVDAVGAFGKHALARAERPALVAGLVLSFFGQPGNDFVRAEDVLPALLRRHRGDTGRRGLRGHRSALRSTYISATPATTAMIMFLRMSPSGCIHLTFLLWHF